MKMDVDTDADEHNDNTGLGENHTDYAQCNSENAPTASKSIEEVKPPRAKDEAACSNVPNKHPQHSTGIDGEPLNLTTHSWDEPLDLSIKNPK